MFSSGCSATACAVPITTVHTSMKGIANHDQGLGQPPLVSAVAPGSSIHYSHAQRSAVIGRSDLKLTKQFIVARTGL